jgi:hypothetical protein
MAKAKAMSVETEAAGGFAGCGSRSASNAQDFE